MTKALMGLEGVAYGMEKPGATYWPSHLSCNAKDIDMVRYFCRISCIEQIWNTVGSAVTNH